MSDSIYLDVTAGTDNDANITNAGAFNGRARMGSGVENPETGVVLYPFNGTWAGQFHNAAQRRLQMRRPMSAVGTFGVQHTDRMGTLDDTSDDEVSSFVGAFGAHRN